MMNNSICIAFSIKKTLNIVLIKIINNDPFTVNTLHIYFTNIFNIFRDYQIGNSYIIRHIIV